MDWLLELLPAVPVVIYRCALVWPNFPSLEVVNKYTRTCYCSWCHDISTATIHLHVSIFSHLSHLFSSLCFVKHRWNSVQHRCHVPGHAGLTHWVLCLMHDVPAEMTHQSSNLCSWNVIFWFCFVLKHILSSLRFGIPPPLVLLVSHWFTDGSTYVYPPLPVPYLLTTCGLIFQPAADRRFLAKLWYFYQAAHFHLPKNSISQAYRTGIILSWVTAVFNMLITFSRFWCWIIEDVVQFCCGMACLQVLSGSRSVSWTSEHFHFETVNLVTLVSCGNKNQI